MIKVIFKIIPKEGVTIPSGKTNVSCESIENGATVVREFSICKASNLINSVFFTKIDSRSRYENQAVWLAFLAIPTKPRVVDKSKHIEIKNIKKLTDESFEIELMEVPKTFLLMNGKAKKLSQSSSISGSISDIVSNQFDVYDDVMIEISVSADGSLIFSSLKSLKCIETCLDNETQLQTTQTALENTRLQLTNTVSQLNSNIEQMNSVIERSNDLTAQLNSSNMQLSSVTNSFNLCNQNKVRLENEFNALIFETSVLENQIEQLFAEKNTLQKQIEQLFTEKNTLQTELDKTKLLLTNAENDKRVLQTEISNLISNLDNRIETLLKEGTDLRRDNTSLNNEIAVLNSSFASCNQEKIRFSEELKRTKNSYITSLRGLKCVWYLNGNPIDPQQHPIVVNVELLMKIEFDKTKTNPYKIDFVLFIEKPEDFDATRPTSFQILHINQKLFSSESLHLYYKVFVRKEYKFQIECDEMTVKNLTFEFFAQHPDTTYEAKFGVDDTILTKLKS